METHIVFCHYNRRGLRRKEAPVATASSYEEAVEKIRVIRQSCREEYGQPKSHHGRFRLYLGDVDVTSITPKVQRLMQTLSV